MEAESVCPYCAEPVGLYVDVSAGASQSYVEDCPVCCRPWRVMATVEEGQVEVVLVPENA